jgi:hypothetical protein
MAVALYPDYSPHAGEEMVVYAGAIPAGAITFDGDLSEWANMPAPYVWTLDNAPRTSEVIRTGEVTKDDFDAIVYFGWIPDENMICFAADVTDDILYAPDANLWNTWKEDCLQICFDPDADNVNYREDFREGQQNFFAVGEGVFDVFLRNPSGTGGTGTSVDAGIDWAYNEPYLFMGLQRGTGGSYTIEVAMALWDDLRSGETGPTTSVPCELTAGKTIPMAFTVRDKEPEEGCSLGFHCCDPGAGDSGGFPNLVLVSLEDTGWGMSVEPTSWGQIKALFK